MEKKLRVRGLDLTHRNSHIHVFVFSGGIMAPNYIARNRGLVVHGVPCYLCQREAAESDWFPSGACASFLLGNVAAAEGVGINYVKETNSLLSYPLDHEMSAHLVQ